MKKKFSSVLAALAILITLLPYGTVSAADTKVLLAKDIVAVSNEIVRKHYPYVWGGESPAEGGFDCTGIIYYIYNTRLGYRDLSLATARNSTKLLKLGTRITNKKDLLPGDIIEYNNCSHAGIYIGNQTVVHAGTSNGVCKVPLNLPDYCGMHFDFAIRLSCVSQDSTALELPQPSLSADYFSCKVKIACVNGQVVNLYDNAGDSSRVTYFSRGQVASSTYGAKLSDGSTWYKITADHNGSSRTFWLKYESKKMTVEDRAKPQTYTVTFNAGSGTVSPSSKTYTAGDTYGTLPTPTYPGYVFKGWLSVRDYTYATPSTTVPDSITLYARWEEETPHMHQKGNVSTCENEHPHRNLYICSICDEQFSDGLTNYVDSCEICNPSDSNTPVDSLANLGQDAINAVKPPHTEHTKDNRIVSSEHPHYVFYTCSVCGEVYTDDSKEAVSTCEECWGPWSDWTSTPVYPSETRQVETRQVKVAGGYTEYRYGRYIDPTGKNNCWCARYLEGLSYVSGKAALQYSNWSKTRYYANGVGWTCGFCNGNHIGVDKVGADGRSWWAEYELPGGDFYWEESRTVSAQYETQYRYRDLIGG